MASTTDPDQTAVLRAEQRTPPVDPTANVLALVAAEGRRQDDLRKAEKERQDDLRNMTDRHARRIGKVKEQARRDQTLAESRRIDAIIAAGQQAIALENARAEGRATALADRVDTAAKTLAASAGRSSGTAAIWAAVGTIAFLVIAGLGLLLALRPAA